MVHNQPSFLSRIERWYLDSVRLLLATAIVIAACIAVLGGIWYVISNLGSTAEHFRDTFVAPDWQAVRPAVLPVAPLVQPEQPRPPALEADAATEPTLDPRITDIATNLSLQFARNRGQETAFTDAYPRRALQAWANDRAGVPADMQEDFITALLDVSLHIGNDPMINRIGSVSDRTATIRDALFSYRDEYVRQATTARERTNAANLQRAADRSAASLKALTLAGGAAAVLLSLLLLVVLMRIEVHLRRLGS